MLSDLRPMNSLSRAAGLAVVAVLIGALPAEAGSEPRELPQAELTADITGDQFLARAAYLASEALEGRETGTAGGRTAEDYVAREFERMGLEPLGHEGTFFVDVKLPGRRGIAHETWIREAGKSADPVAASDGEDERDVLPFGFSANGTAEGGVAFVGYGLRDSDNGYDDYAGIDVNGRLVIVLRHAPRENDESSPWHRSKGRGVMRQLAFTTKARAAADAGAAALLMVNDYNHEEDSLPVGIGGAPASIPVLGITRGVADRLLAPSGKSLRELQAAIDAETMPRSLLVDGPEFAVQARLSDTSGRNVLAVRRGSDAALRDEAIVICAHMDHVGLGYFGSTKRGVAGQVHNGADDNASGTAALLEVAEFLASQPAPRRTLVFAAWCGEEKGLVGSRTYASQPEWPIAQTVACLNMDMVGYYRTGGEKDQGLIVGGAPTGDGFKELVDRLGAEADAQVTHSWMAWEQSDHYAFYAKDVPSLFFTTGMHAEYHGPGDDWWKLNREGAAKVAGVVTKAALALANAAGRPEFAKRPPRPVLGVRMGADDPDRKGAPIGSVFPKLGAAIGGMQAGDLVVSWGGKPVTSRQDLGKFIAASTPGATVEVGIEREGKALTLRIKVSGM